MKDTLKTALGVGVVKMNYSYQDLKQDLEIGHELHFVYKRTKYSITHTPNGWHLSKFYGEYHTFESHVELLDRGTIEGHKLQDVWNEVTVEVIF
jgi:hypothetical protein